MNNNNIKVNVMFYDKHYSEKPSGYEIATIQTKLTKTTISISDLAHSMATGCTFKPGYLNGTKNKDFISQQIFALDFDDGTTIEQELDRCKELNILPVFGYTSFHHKEEHHKFRLVFCNKEVVYDIEKRNKIQLTLMSLFTKCDKSCKDLSRLFFGGKSLIMLNTSNIIDGDSIIDKYYVPDTKPPTVKPKESNALTTRLEREELPCISDMEEKVKAISELDVHKMRCLLDINGAGDLGYSDKKESYSITVPKTSSDDEKGIEKTNVFKCKADLFDYIRKIDLGEYLGIEGHVKCILPDHNDSNPSAHIYTNSNGIQFYKCFGCGKARPIIEITEELAGCTRSQAIEFIKEVYGLELVESEWVQKHKQLIIDSANYLDSDEFENSFPEMNKLIRTRKNDIKALLLHFSEKVNEDMQIDGKPFFFGSYPTLMKICGTANDHKLAQSLALFSLLNLIEKLPDCKIPTKEYNKAKHIAAKYGLKKITNFYSFEEYGVGKFNGSEEKAKILKENHISLKGLSREWVLRTYGIEEANRVYPQYRYENKKGVSEKSNIHTEDITICLLNLIDTRGYAKENEIIFMLNDKYNKTATEVQIKKSLQEILNSYDLIRVRANKELKAKYNIEESGYPCIIIRNNKNNSDVHKSQNEKENK